MDGLICICVGGVYNAYRIYKVLLRAGDSSSVQLKGTVGGFVAGAFVFGLPVWGTL